MSVSTAGPSALTRHGAVLVVALGFHAVGTFLLIRSVRLALLGGGGIALAALWAFGVLTLLRLPVTEPVLGAVLAVMAVAAVAAAQILYAVVTEQARGAFPAAAARAVAARWMRPGAGALFAAICGLAVLTPVPGGAVRDRLFIAAAALSVLPAVLLLVPALASRVRMDEDFAAAYNRLRERREERALSLAWVGAARWAFAVSGIFCVLFAIVFFDGGLAVRSGLPSTVLVLWTEAGPALALAAALAGLSAAVGAGDWRMFFACMLPSFALATAAAWAGMWFGIADTPVAIQVLALAGAAGAGIACLLAARLTAYRRFGDDMASAYVRALQDCGAPVAVSLLALSAPLVLFGGYDVVAWLTALVLAGQLVAVLVVMPALATVLSEIFPRRRTLEEMYGLR